VATQIAIRPMREDDAPAVDELCRRVLYHEVPGEPEAERRARSLARIEHLRATDPDGAWVAEQDAAIAGVALALVRERVWGLSLFAVADEVQRRGVGRRLLDAALACAPDARGRIILSTEHPGAMRRYALAGLSLHPCVQAGGIPDRARIPDVAGQVEDAGAAGIPVADAVARHVRGAGHGRDLPLLLENRCRLLTFEDRAFAVLGDFGVVPLLGGRDEEAATAVLAGAMAACPPGTTISLGFLTAGQQWAVRACLEAGLVLSPDGPVFLSGDIGPFAPYVPSGWFL
jgi:GNAT superfamily N-acetyltransferase